MLILGLQGSPRKKGNTNHLLTRFLEAAGRHGARTCAVHVVEKNIVPCKEYVVCEKKGYCPIEDDMATEIYGLLREAEVVVLASPIFFYNMTAQIKALVDRCQTFWARKYRLKLGDPLKPTRSGYLLSAGATRGKNLFEGLQLTAKYFFDAIDARFAGSLCYRGAEGPKDLARRPEVAADVEQAVAELMKPYAGRRRLLFAGRRDAGRGRMAAAFAQQNAGSRWDVESAGSHPAGGIDDGTLKVMQEIGIDLAFLKPRGLESVRTGPAAPEVIVDVGADGPLPTAAGARRLDWRDLKDPDGRPIEELRAVRDEIRARVEKLAADPTV
jgi:multimeric flavodoxin WrbA/protein-tyrosine-phosphatase